jgi:hypothetical protein
MSQFKLLLSVCNVHERTKENKDEFGKCGLLSEHWFYVSVSKIRRSCVVGEVCSFMEHNNGVHINK